MLTLKSPIKLNCTNSFLKMPLSLNEKIPANYELMSANFVPNDLLLLMSVGMEEPENGNINTDIISTSNLFSSSKVNVEVINNVINRILMDNAVDFSYQDSVYVTSILNKLGITDAKSFVNEVRNIRLENKAITEQLNLYTSSKDLLKVINKYEKTVGAKPKDAALAEGITEADSVNIDLWQSIYKRLQSKEIYNTVSDFSHSEIYGNNYYNSAELNLSEYKRVSRTLQMAEIKTAVGFLPEALQYTNIYEENDGENPLQSEAAVISRSTEAAMLHIATSVITANSNNIFHSSMQATHIENAISKTANTTIKRFLENHNSPSYCSYSDININNKSFLKTLQLENNVLQTVTKTAKNVINLSKTKVDSTTLGASDYTSIVQNSPFFGQSVQLFKLLQSVTRTEQSLSLLSNLYVDRAVANSVTAWIEALTEHENITNVLQEFSKDNTISKTIVTSTAFNTTDVTLSNISVDNEETNIEKNSTLSVSNRNSQNKQEINVLNKTTDNTENISKNTVTHVDKMANFVDKLNEHLEISVLIGKKPPQKVVPPPADIVLTKPVVEELSTPIEPRNPEPLTASVMLKNEVAFFESQNSVISNTLSQNQIKNSETVENSVTNALEQLISNQENISKESNIALSEIKEQHIETDITNISNNLSQDEQVNVQNSTVEIKQELDRIDQKNKLMYQKMVEAEQSQPPKPLPNITLDKARTRRDALLAIENPEKVIAELLAEPALTPKEKEMPKVLQTILQNVDPETRTMYETLIRYSSDPEAVIQSGLLTKGSQGTLLSDLKNVEMEIESRAESINAAEVEAANATQTAVLQHIIEEKDTVIESNNNTFYRNPVSIIHKMPEKRAENEEEVQEKNVTTTKQVVNREQVESQTTNISEINKVNNSVVTKTTEDISSIVNRTLAKEIGTITDKVYSQMEKRLGMERMRRGRF